MVGEIMLACNSNDKNMWELVNHRSNIGQQQMQIEVSTLIRFQQYKNGVLIAGIRIPLYSTRKPDQLTDFFSRQYIF